MRILISVAVVFGLLVARGAHAAEIDFAHDIAPILREHCGGCHTGDKKQGSFSMNTRAALMAGGESGPAVVAGRSAMSDLVKRITSDDKDLRMPPEGPRLPAAKIKLLTQWIDAGVPWQDGFAFKKAAYEPPLKPRRPHLPPPLDGREHPIDRLLDAYLSQHKLTPPAPLADAALARRASLDLVGLLPTSEQLDRFLSDPDPAKRRRLIHDLLADETAYAEHWLSFWNDLLRNDYTGTGFITGGRKQITGWLYRSLITNKPYDQFVRELISPTAESEGFIQGIRWRGNVSASQSQEVQFAQSICQSLLGINMKCASCHDSFIDRWKLDEAYGLAAIYSSQPLEIYRCDKPTGRKAQAAWIFPELGQIDPAAPQPERLKQLAALMTHPENGRFTRTIVNRLWHRLMGRGIVYPTDAMGTEPWHTDLLDYLAVDLADHGYDLKHTIELICTSHAYQSRATMLDRAAEDKGYVFRGPLAKRMTAEQFVDAVWQVTGAAPSKIDAPVQRGKIDTPAAATAASSARWIWSYPQASAASPAGETITVRKRFELAELPASAVAAITCDNAYTLFVNGQKLASDDDWNSVDLVALGNALRVGANEILIVAQNGGAGPNPAGLFFEARLRSTDNAYRSVVSDKSWDWTPAKPNAQGVLTAAGVEWKSASEVEHQDRWASAVTPDSVARLFRDQSQGGRMVRASLVKLDALMRSLGRPNRDQIVTMRPSELTTLEAIDLANAQTLADALTSGAQKMLRESPNGKPNPDQLVRHLFRSAVAREPTSDEFAEARAMLGDVPSAAAIEDLLWSVFMLPEFQLVR